MNREELADALVPIAAELVGTVRDYGPDDVAEVLSRVPEGRFDALAVVLAAMVDPDQRPQQLLAWTSLGPVSSRPDLVPWRACADCGELVRHSHLLRHNQRHHAVAV